ncbi:MAG: thiol-disulfide oxidoreductase DCC family protein [Mycobacteriales bacterium]
MIEISARPVFLYDGDCAFCSSCARFISRRLNTNALVVPWQTVAIEPLGVTVQQCDAAVQWIAQDNSVTNGPQAIAWLLIDAGSIWRPLGWLLRIPPASWLAEPIYRLISRNRHRMPGGTAACSLPQAQRDQRNR